MELMKIQTLRQTSKIKIKFYKGEKGIFKKIEILIYLGLIILALIACGRETQ